MRAVLTVALLSVTILAGCLASDSNSEAVAASDYVAPAVPEVDAQQTVEMLKHFSTTYPTRVDNGPDHLGARDFIAEQFESFGLDVHRQKFTTGIDQENILGILWGEVTDEWVVVGGHYDIATKDCVVGNTLSSPTSGSVSDDSTCFNRQTTQGAYDDGSGIVQTIELARAFAELTETTGIKPYYTMVFVPFDGEERGLEGSGAFSNAILNGGAYDCVAINCRDPDLPPLPFNDGHITLRGMLDLDMAGINWPGTEAPLYFDTNTEALEAKMEIWRTAIEMPEDKIKYQGIALGRSDYHWFFQMGTPTGFFISDFEEWELPADSGVVTPSPSTVPNNPASNRWPAYPFWHLEDTVDTMILMAGSEEDVVSGFQTVLDLSANLLHLYAMQPTVELDAPIPEQ